MIPKPARPTRILIVGDEHEVRDGAERLLKSDGYRVDSAKSEAEAVKRVGLEKPDLLLVSLAGPALQVVNTAKRIRHKGGLTEQTPIVIFSVSTAPEGSEEEVGENVYITVPDNFNQLRALLARVLDSESRTQ